MLTLTACPPKRPPLVETVASAALLPTLVRSWAELPADPYPELAAGPASLAALRRTHDVDRWTSASLLWGALPVLQFEDTDRPQTAQGALAAWFVAPGEGGEERVQAVTLRDFEGAPTGPTPEDLLLSLGEGWSAPWALCRPVDAAHADLVIAIDASGRRKLGLAPSKTSEDAWTVDHVDYLAAELGAAAWLEAKGYGGCTDAGTLMENGRLKPPREVRGGPDAPGEGP